MEGKLPAVLGIDAAWTLTEPSGVALVAKYPTGWRLIAAESSYQRFVGLTDRSAAAKEDLSSSRSNPFELLAAAKALSSRVVDVVAVDMPLAHSPISARRVADNAVSRAYGSRKCGTHSPSALRPGKVSDELTEAFGRAGYPLRTTKIASPALIEVYPHPALVELAGASERLAYKASKVRAYWPQLIPSARRERLYRQWRDIASLLEDEITGVADRLVVPDLGASSVEVKACEDTLDAIVCAWVGICALEGRAIAYGDDHSAIWIPKITANVKAGKSPVAGMAG